MKNLYAALGLEFGASDAQLAAILAQTPEKGAQVAILLNPQKRALYDRAHTTLQAIGTLRQRLGLDAGESWFLESYSEFSPQSHAAVFSAQPAAGHRAAAVAMGSRAAPPPGTVPAKRSAGPRKWPVPVLLGLLGLAVVILLIAFNFR